MSGHWTVARRRPAGGRAGGGRHAWKRHSQHAKHAPHLGAVRSIGVAGVATVDRGHVGRRSACPFALGPVGLVNDELRQAPRWVLQQNQVFQSDLVVLVAIGADGHAAVTDGDVVGVPLDALSVASSLVRIPVQVALEPGQAGARAEEHTGVRPRQRASPREGSGRRRTRQARRG